MICEFVNQNIINKKGYCFNWQYPFDKDKRNVYSIFTVPYLLSIVTVALGFACSPTIPHILDSV
jgi:hypothetical protein